MGKSPEDFTKESIDDSMLKFMAGFTQTFTEELVIKYLEELKEKIIAEFMSMSMEGFMKNKPLKRTATKTQKNKPKMKVADEEKVYYQSQKKQNQRIGKKQVSNFNSQ